MVKDYPPIRPFSVALAREYKGFMKASSVTGAQIAAKLGRNDGYVSERANGKRPLDMDDIDALASLVHGWDGQRLMLELVRRAEASTQLDAVNAGHSGDDAGESAATAAPRENENSHGYGINLDAVRKAADDAAR
ncbi:MAG: hypothetical protein QM677_04975 [Microbacterium sp.]